jgi:soluble lytic murein transglycosylase
MRPTFAALAALSALAGPAAARAQDMPALLRQGNWPLAYAAATQMPDPIAARLVVFARLLAPNQATAAEIAAFMAANPDWPLQYLLVRRRDEAIAADPDDAAALAACDGARPAVAAPPARLRCAEADAHAGRPEDATALIRRTWIEGPADPAWETRMMQAHGALFGRAEQWHRFDRLAWTDTDAAKRQSARLDAADRPRAEARLALRRGDSAGPALVAALPEAQRSDPALVLEQAKWLRRVGQDVDALALWRSSGAAAERAAPAERQPAFWDERNLLARRRLRDGDAAGAYALADGYAGGGSEPMADAAFLAGFIALRRLNDPAEAARHFTELAGLSKAAITLGRAHYWLARAAAARGDSAGATAEYQQAAAYPTTYYGQLAMLALGEDSGRLLARLRSQRDPAATPAQALALAGQDLARAAAYMVIWGEPGRAQSFLLKLQEMLPDAADQALLARFAAGLDMPPLAVTLARRAGRGGVSLIDSGWPMPVAVPPTPGLDPALALAVMRQESSFDTETVSPVGARGLMQLMPATAAVTARQLGIAATPSSLNAALLSDRKLNMQLGSAYLRGLLTQFAGAVPLAVGAYNAGPSRVLDWLTTNGDPRGPSAGTPAGPAADIIDWIELIPFGETRNYVQRVIENDVIYRAKRGETDAHPLAAFLART